MANAHEKTPVNLQSSSDVVKVVDLLLEFINLIL